MSLFSKKVECSFKWLVCLKYKFVPVLNPCSFLKNTEITGNYFLIVLAIVNSNNADAHHFAEEDIPAFLAVVVALTGKR